MQLHGEARALLDLQFALGVLDPLAREARAAPFGHHAQRLVPDEDGGDQHEQRADHAEELCGSPPAGPRADLDVGAGARNEGEALETGDPGRRGISFEARKAVSGDGHLAAGAGRRVAQVSDPGHVHGDHAPSAGELELARVADVVGCVDYLAFQPDGLAVVLRIGDRVAVRVREERFGVDARDLGVRFGGGRATLDPYARIGQLQAVQVRFGIADGGHARADGRRRVHFGEDGEKVDAAAVEIDAVTVHGHHDAFDALPVQDARTRVGRCRERIVRRFPVHRDAAFVEQHQLVAEKAEHRAESGDVAGERHLGVDQGREPGNRLGVVLHDGADLPGRRAQRDLVPGHVRVVAFHGGDDAAYAHASVGHVGIVDPPAVDLDGFR